jgi:c-di-GMP-binding flagellar brake protein YcgR
MERRKYKRIDNTFNVRIALSNDPSGYRDIKIDVAKSINISAGGLLLNASEKIGLGEKIRVTFLKPNTFEFFEGFGKVVRSDDTADGSFLIGIDFIDLNDQEKMKLDYYITLCKD